MSIITHIFNIPKCRLSLRSKGFRPSHSMSQLSQQSSKFGFVTLVTNLETSKSIDHANPFSFGFSENMIVFHFWLTRLIRTRIRDPAHSCN